MVQESLLKRQEEILEKRFGHSVEWHNIEASFTVMFA